MKIIRAHIRPASVIPFGIKWTQGLRFYYFKNFTLFSTFCAIFFPCFKPSSIA